MMRKHAALPSLAAHSSLHPTLMQVVIRWSHWLQAGSWWANVAGMARTSHTLGGRKLSSKIGKEEGRRKGKKECYPRSHLASWQYTALTIKVAGLGLTTLSDLCDFSSCVTLQPAVWKQPSRTMHVLQSRQNGGRTPAATTTALVVVSVILVLLSAGSIVLRFYARRMKHRPFGADDVWLLIAWVSHGLALVSPRHEIEAADTERAHNRLVRFSCLSMFGSVLPWAASTITKSTLGGEPSSPP